MNIELIYDKDCPNVPLARERLVKSLNQESLSTSWKEWERSDSNAPSYASRYASPTILVNGMDVSGETSSLDGHGGCRIYRKTDGSAEGSPSIESIVAALQTRETAPIFEGSAKPSNSRASLFSSLGAIVFAALPVGACPACLPAYVGALSAFGLGLAFDPSSALLILGILLTISLATLAWKANQRNGYKPLFLGIASSLLIVLGKANLEAEPILYTGFGLLVLACIWNAWPRKKPLKKAACCR